MSTVPTAIPNEPAQQAAPSPAPQEPNWWDQPEPAEPEPQAPAAGAPQAPPQSEYFIQAPSGTVYKAGDLEGFKRVVAEGVTEKDRMIAQQKADLERYQQMLAAQGVHIGQQPPQQPQQQTLVDALGAAVERGDMTFDQAMAQFVQQQTQTQFQQFLPMVEYTSLNQAVEVAGQSYDPNIPAFVRSQAYAKTLERWPTLKMDIQTAARNPHIKVEGSDKSFGQLLPELLAQAFYLAKNAAAPAAPPVQRPAPQSTTPPQSPQFAAPQGPPAGQGFQLGQFRNPFDEAWAKVSDIPLTKENLGG